MSLFLSIAVLAATPQDTQRNEQPVEAAIPQMTSNFSSFDQLADSLSSRVQTGTLLFSKGDCLAVRIYTQSSYTHVAMIVMRNGEPLVYDSMNGIGARCLTLKNYLNTQRPATIHVFQPKTAFNPTNTTWIRSWEPLIRSGITSLVCVPGGYTAPNTPSMHSQPVT